MTVKRRKYDIGSVINRNLIEPGTADVQVINK
jgi:hypothetical protein